MEQKTKSGKSKQRQKSRLKTNLSKVKATKTIERNYDGKSIRHKKPGRTKKAQREQEKYGTVRKKAFTHKQ